MSVNYHFGQIAGSFTLDQIKIFTPSSHKHSRLRAGISTTWTTDKGIKSDFKANFYDLSSELDFVSVL